MARQFSFTVDHMVGRREIELVVTYSMLPGYPEQGPTYACGGTPAEDAEIEIISVTHDGKPFALSDAEEEALLDEAYGRCEQDWQDDWATAMEYRADQRRDDEMFERWERGQ